MPSMNSPRSAAGVAVLDGYIYGEIEFTNFLFFFFLAFSCSFLREVEIFWKRKKDPEFVMMYLTCQ